MKIIRNVLNIFSEKPPCEETTYIFNYVEERFQGIEAVEPKINYPIHKKMVSYFIKLFDNERQMGLSTKKLLNITRIQTTKKRNMKST